jgi:hypothetical protein
MMVIVHLTSEKLIARTISFFVLGQINNNLLKLHS